MDKSPDKAKGTHLFGDVDKDRKDDKKTKEVKEKRSMVKQIIMDVLERYNKAQSNLSEPAREQIAADIIAELKAHQYRFTPNRSTKTTGMTQKDWWEKENPELNEIFGER